MRRGPYRFPASLNNRSLISLVLHLLIVHIVHCDVIPNGLIGESKNGQIGKFLQTHWIRTPISIVLSLGYQRLVGKMEIRYSLGLEVFFSSCLKNVLFLRWIPSMIWENWKDSHLFAMFYLLKRRETHQILKFFTFAKN